MQKQHFVYCIDVIGGIVRHQIESDRKHEQRRPFQFDRQERHSLFSMSRFPADHLAPAAVVFSRTKLLLLLLGSRRRFTYLVSGSSSSTNGLHAKVNLRWSFRRTRRHCLQVPSARSVHTLFRIIHIYNVDIVVDCIEQPGAKKATHHIRCEKDAHRHGGLAYSFEQKGKRNF